MNVRKESRRYASEVAARLTGALCCEGNVHLNELLLRGPRPPAIGQRTRRAGMQDAAGIDAAAHGTVHQRMERGQMRLNFQQIKSSLTP